MKKFIINLAIVLLCIVSPVYARSDDKQAAEYSYSIDMMTDSGGNTQEKALLPDEPGKLENMRKAPLQKGESKALDPIENIDTKEKDNLWHDLLASAFATAAIVGLIADLAWIFFIEKIKK